jgi:hypothetical protein
MEAAIMGTATETFRYRCDSCGSRSALIDHDGGRFTYSCDTVNWIKEVLNPEGDRIAGQFDAFLGQL